MTGQNCIDHLIILQPSQLTFDAIRTLAHSSIIKKIYIPVWKGDLSQNQKRAYAQFMHTVKDNQIEIIRIKSPISIKLGQSFLALMPQPKKIKSKEIEYNAWHITGNIQGTALNCLSHKAQIKTNLPARPGD
jgi:UDP-3-O-acyl-N-acetylglucosamine deacetylase